MLIKNLVSIIVPTYNVEPYIEETIKSVQMQKNVDWELLIVDDLSTDNTIKIIQKIQNKDSRIKLISLNENKGAAYARNIAIENSSGEFIAFLDSDDVWYENKLELQINFMRKNHIHFCSTSYEKVNEKGEKINVNILAPKKLNYQGLLKKCPGNSTVIYNADKLGKIYTPVIRKRNDYALWLQVIKKSENLYGMSEILSNHRVRENGISHNKKSLIKYHWIVYREIEELSIVKSIQLINYWVLKGIVTKIIKRN